MDYFRDSRKKGVRFIVIQHELLPEQCIKLHTLSFNYIAKNLQDARSFALSKPSISLQRSRLVLENILFEWHKHELLTEPN